MTDPEHGGTDRTLHTTRWLAAPPARVWQALTDPAQLARWWGPEGFSNVFDTFDCRPGGDWTLTMVGPDGQGYPNASRFVVLELGRRWVLDHVSPPRFTLTLTLAADGAGTRLGWSQCFETAELCRALAPVCVPANEQNLDRLERVLAGGAETVADGG